MSGLFRRARAIRTRLNLLGEDIDRDGFVTDISDDERQHVMSDIDTMLQDGRVSTDDSELRFEPKNKAFMLPLVLNLGALVILVVGTLVMFLLFDRSEENLASTGRSLSSAEGRILENLRREAEAELGAKDAELDDYRSRLADLESQRELLENQTDSIIAEREEALRREYEGNLAAERARLSQEGVSGEELTLALASYETEIRNEFEASLETARQDARDEENRRIAELDAQRQEYQGLIDRADADRQRIQQELAARDDQIAELAAQSEAEAAQAGEASRQLTDLRAQQDRDKLVSDQINAFYSEIGTARNRDDSESALETLNALEAYLAEPAIAGSAVVLSRGETDRFLVPALRRLIELENQPVGDDAVVSIDEDAQNTLTALAAGASQGRRLSESGDFDGAREAWLSAFSAVPELEEAFREVLDRESTVVAAPVGVVLTDADLKAAREEGAAGARASFAEDLENARIAGRAEALAETETNLTDARQEGYIAGRADATDEADEVISGLRERLSSLETGIRGLRDRYTASLESVRETESERQESLVELLQSKLTIKGGLEEALHDELDTYADSVGSLQENQARESVYGDIVDFLTALTSDGQQ
jgi:chromosome segregation ATPase